MRYLLMIPAAAIGLGIAAPASAQDVDAEAVTEQFEQSVRADLGRILDDPELPEKAARSTEALVAVLETLPIGNIEAAIEGREPTEADRARTLGDIMDVDGREIGDELAVAITENRPRIEAGIDAAVVTLPALIAAVESLRVELEAIARD